MNIRDLREYIPFTGIVDGCVLSKRGDLTFGWRVWLPTAFTVNEPGYDSIINSFLQAYKVLPAWCVVHKQDIFKYDRFKAGKNDFFLAECYERHFDGREYLNGYSYLYLSFSSKAVINNKNSNSGFFGIADNKSVKEEAIRYAAGIASQFEAILSANPLLALEALTTDDFLREGPNGRDEGVIPDYLRLYTNSGPDYNINFEADHIRYGDDILKIWYVEDSDAYPGSVSSVNFISGMSSGSSKVFLSGGSPIGYQLKIPHIVNRYILTLPKNTVEKELDERKRLMTSFSLYSSSCAVNSEELKDYLYQVAKESTTTVKCYMDIEAWGPENKIADIRNDIVSAFSDLNVSVVEERDVVPALHYAAIPGSAPELGYDNYLNSEITAFLCHGLWDGYDFGIKNGVVGVCDRKCMVPIKIDIQSLARSRGQINNMNALVIGPSGSGKSFTMNSLVQDFYTHDEHILIVDVGDSYEGLCAVVREHSGGKDGVYNTYDPEHPFGFNPFKGREKWNEVDEEGDHTSSGYEFILSLLQTMYQPAGGWDKTSSAVLNFLLNDFLNCWDGSIAEYYEEALRDAYVNERRRRWEKTHEKDEKFPVSRQLIGFRNPIPSIFPEERKGKDPVFDDFFQYVTRIVVPLLIDGTFKMGDITVDRDMFDATSFGASMDMFKKAGKYGFLLNAETESDLFQSRLTVFEVDKIKNNEELFPLWLLCIMHSFEDKMRTLQCQKVMIIEEAWSAIAKPSMAAFITWLWRTARKFKTSAVVVSQSITDLTGSDIVKDAIIQNTDVKILLDQRKNANNFQNSVSVLGLSPMATNLVLSVGTDLDPKYKYKEAFFAIGEQYSNVFAMEVSLEQALCFETDKTLKKPLFERAKQCGSMIQAIKDMAAEIRNGNKK